MLEIRKSKILLCLLSLQILIVNLVYCESINDGEISLEKYSYGSYCFASNKLCACETESSTRVSVICKSIIMSVENNDEVIIECRNVNPKSFQNELLPRVLVAAHQTAKIENCPLRDDETLENLIKRLGIKDCRSLSFSSSQRTLNKYQFSGLQSVVNFGFDVESDQALPSDLFEGMTNVENLSLRTNQALLPLGLFDPMIQLKNLIIVDKGHSTEFAPGIFQNLKNLESVNISYYKDLIISKNVFVNATNIKMLILHNNNNHNNNEVANNIPNDICDHLTNLNFLYLIENFHSELSKRIFQNLTKLKHFKLISSTAKLRTLPVGFFGNLSSLTHIEVSANLEELPENLFQESRNLSFISLKENKLRSLSVNLFSDQWKLEYLDLSKNLLTTLPIQIFRNTSLKHLILSDNQLTTVSYSVFGYMRSLETLWLDNNNLSSIDEGALWETISLQYLNLSRNHLDANSMREVFHCYDIYDELRTLDFSYNNISSIAVNDFFSLFRQELELNLMGNRIETIDFSTENPLYFGSNITVNLSDNPIRCDCKMMPFAKYLKNQKELKVETESLLCREPRKFNGLKFVDIDLCALRCPVTQTELCPKPCQCEQRTCDGTFIIDCSKSKLSKLPTLTPMVEKIQLDLQNNDLKDLPLNRPKNYDNVYRLNLSGNNLENIQVSQLPVNLEFLDLRGNNLRTLPSSVFEEFSSNSSKLKEIYLSHNSWLCNCDSQILLEFALRNNKKLVDTNDLQCLDSSSKLLPLMNFKVSQLCANEKNRSLIIASSIAISGLMIALLVALYFSFKKEIKIWLYSHNMCWWFVSIEDLEKDKEYDGFVSYSHKDKEFVQEELLPFLEQGPHPFKICDHERDWLVGETIPQQIIESVENSRRTIIILSDNYLESVWGRMEFQAAHQLAMKERQAKLIIIVYGELKKTDKIDNELKAYLSMNTYLEWGNPWFWKKLLYAMPHSKYSKTLQDFSSSNQETIELEN